MFKPTLTYVCSWNAETRMTPQQALDHSWMAAAKIPNMTNGRLAGYYSS